MRFESRLVHVKLYLLGAAEDVRALPFPERKLTVHPPVSTCYRVHDHRAKVQIPFFFK